ncbi:MAG: hypothetical protein JJU22_16515 [Gammaproteobacteria bacterium]|nr:hypothetical protein [Gammaproteobacteria bacterium]
MCLKVFHEADWADGQVAVFLLSAAVVFTAGCLLWFPVRNVAQDLTVADGFLSVVLFWLLLGLAVAILPILGVGGMQLYRAEVSGVTKSEKLTPRLADTARALWAIYVTLTIGCATAYWLAGMSPFDAVCHAFTTVSTAGFSTHDASLGHFDSPVIEFIATIFMLLGAVNFALHFLVWRRRDVAIYRGDGEVLVFLAVTLGAALLIGVTLVASGVYGDSGEGMRYAWFQVVSVITTTGYGTATFAEWPLYIPMLLVALAVVGGCGGSTAGGMKVIRVMLLFKQAEREMVSMVHPSSVSVVKLNGMPVPEPVLKSVWGFYTLYSLTALLLMLAMLAAGLDIESALGAVVASITLLGPGLGEVATSFADVNAVVKWLAVVGMLVGRL